MGKSIKSATGIVPEATDALVSNGSEAAAAMPSPLFLKKFLLLFIYNRFYGMKSFMIGDTNYCIFWWDWQLNAIT
jgi:hypothetical protein